MADGTDAETMWTLFVSAGASMILIGVSELINIVIHATKRIRRESLARSTSAEDTFANLGESFLGGGPFELT